MSPVVYFLERLTCRFNKLFSPSPERVEAAFKKSLHFFNKTPMQSRFWICGGVLLGYAREGAIIRGDTDIDFHYWVEDEALLLEVLQGLPGKEFEYVGRYVNNEGVVTQHVLKVLGVKVEFFAAWRKDNCIEWNCYTTRHWNRPIRQFLNRIPDLQFEPVQFYEVEVFKPVDHDLYLRALYGDWRKPMTDYTYYVDSAAIVSCEPWRNGW